MRDHASQSIDHVVGSAGKVLGLAGDIGLGGARIVGGLFSRTSATIDHIRQPKTIEDVQEVLSGSDSARPRSLTDTLLRRPAASPPVAAEMQDASVLTDSREQDEPSAKAPAALGGDAPTSLASRLAALPGISGFAATTAEHSKAATSSAEPAATALAKVEGCGSYSRCALRCWHFVGRLLRSFVCTSASSFEEGERFSGGLDARKTNESSWKEQRSRYELSCATGRPSKRHWWSQQDRQHSFTDTVGSASRSSQPAGKYRCW